MLESTFHPSTLALHAGYGYDSQRTLSVPIYQSSSFRFDSSDQAGRRFALEELGNIYSRLSNPTTDVLANRLAQVDGGGFGVVTASGASALFYAFVNLAQAGDNILYANKIYGGTQTLLVHTLKRFGIEARCFDVDDLSTLEPLIDNNTKAIFFESLSNPQISIPDICAITELAKRHKLATICDNTIAPMIFRPFDFGIDIAVYSCTKYINGHGSGLGGAIIESKGLNELLIDNPRYSVFNTPFGIDIAVYSCTKYINGHGSGLGGAIIESKGLNELLIDNPRYSVFNTPDPSYHGLVYASLPYPIYGMRLILEWLRNIGASLSPHNAWIHLQGLETLELRLQKHSQNALEIATFLESHPKVKQVEYPALESSPYYARFKQYFTSGYASGLFSFELESYEKAKALCDRLKLFCITANIGDSKSLVIHPASQAAMRVGFLALS